MQSGDSNVADRDASPLPCRHDRPGAVGRPIVLSIRDRETAQVGVEHLRPQRAQAGHHEIGVLQGRDTAAVVTRDRHAVRLLEQAVETHAPVAIADRVTEFPRWKRQHHVGLAAELTHELEAEDVRAAGRGPVRRQRSRGGE